MGEIIRIRELPKPKSKAGRGKAWWKNPDKFNRLKSAFENDYNITEACISAEISHASYYTWREKYPDKALMLENNRLRPRMASKKLIVARIKKGDLDNAWEFLRTRDPEYKPTQKREISGPDGGPILVEQKMTKEEVKLMKLAIEHDKIELEKARRKNSGQPKVKA